MDRETEDRIMKEAYQKVGSENEYMLRCSLSKAEHAIFWLDSEREMRVRLQSGGTVTGKYIKAEFSHFRFTRTQVQVRYKVTQRCDNSDSAIPNAPKFLDREFTLKRLPSKQN